MKPDDVRVLLEDASAHVGQPDLTDRVWADATVQSRRHHRVGAAVSVLAVVGLVVAGVVAAPRVTRGGTDVAPSPEPLPSATVPTTGTVDGAPYWLGPEAGSEAWLDHIDTIFGDRLTVPDGTIEDLRQRPVRRVAAVLLRQVPGADRYRPVILSVSGRWAEAELELVPTKDAAGNSALPLDSTAVSPNGAQVAFAQPGQVVLLDTQTSQVRRIPVPSATIENVAWMQTGDRLLAGGAGGSYRVLMEAGPGEQAVQKIDGPADPLALTAPLALDSDAGGEILVGYTLTGRRRVDQRPVLPVQQWTGSTFTAGSLAGRGFQPGPIPDLTAKQASHAVAVVEAHPDVPAKILVLPNSAQSVRMGGCCTVLGWYDDRTVLFESRTNRDDWLLGWNVLTGQVMRVTELGADVVAVGPTLVR